jgi:PAS domain S-box-containing protein
MDVTERKKKEEEIRLQSEIMTNMSEGVYLIRLEDLIIVYANPRFEEMFGYDPGEMIGKYVAIVNTPSNKTPEETNYEIVGILKETGEWHGEILNIKKDGTLFWCYANVSLFDHPEYGKVIVSVHTDITERKKREEEIFDLAQFPSENPYPVLRVNRNRVMYINEVGQRLLKIVDYNQIPNIFQEGVRKTFESNQFTELETEFNGRVYSFILNPVKEKDYVNIYGMDITERKHIEDKLKEVNRLKSEFLRRASHELKTPLISIKGFSDLILSLYINQLDAVIVLKLKEINYGCERLQKIINNLLEASRLETTDLKPKLQVEDLSFLIKFCVHELESLVVSRNQSIRLDIPLELFVKIEKEEIHDVISNLLTNAIKYTPPNGKIEIKTELKEDSVVVSVKDNGIGFTEEQKTKIFQQFGKIERYGQGLDLGIDGTGLGLYISKRIVESHGGKIWMDSEGKNKGASFYFSLPTAK